MNLQELLKKNRKELGSVSFANSKYGAVSKYVDTGIYSLNRILSGSVYNGIPNGKVTLLGGENSTGKSLLVGQMAANALKRNYAQIYYFDSEGGALKSFLENCGCDVNLIEQVLVDSVEDATVKILKTYANCLEFKKSSPENEKVDFLFALDSLGNLVTNKFITDATEKDKQTGDQGQRAKLCNSLLKGLTIPALRSDIPMIITNHVYDDPNAMYQSKIKNQSGGKGLGYVCSIGVQCTKTFAKDEEKDSETAYVGSNLKFLTTKNRICRPFYECESYIDFDKGVARYSGLFEPALKYGLIQEPSSGFFQVPLMSGDKKHRRKDLEENEDMWKILLQPLDELSRKEIGYKSMQEAAQFNSSEEDKEADMTAEADMGKSIKDIEAEVLNAIDKVEDEGKPKRVKVPKNL